MQPKNFSGAPALLLPRSALQAWHGILTFDDDRRANPDFVDESGRRWFVSDVFDSENPVTHYDHLCVWFDSRSVDTRTMRIGGHDALAISTGDDTFGWWAEKQAIVGNAPAPPDEKAWAAATWAPLGEISFTEEDLVLMNSTAHGAQIQRGGEASEHESLTLPPGPYRMESARISGAFLVRFVAAPTP